MKTALKQVVNIYNNLDIEQGYYYCLYDCLWGVEYDWYYDSETGEDYIDFNLDTDADCVSNYLFTKVLK